MSVTNSCCFGKALVRQRRLLSLAVIGHGTQSRWAVVGGAHRCPSGLYRMLLKYLELLAKVYSNIAGSVVSNYLHQNYVISLL